ncbi:Holliday junction DNA helicase RuvB [Candidatus Azambacteria bacterium RIFCSPHIGHO2_01_46_10]|nr:MAG: Holliday junction DNA helicase RuvB [Candidatus Azambacteria bacterium RIFCSPHIGHO2_02_46_12]OGD36021.1 MAG: Holliday junction DNA helicase RuvB [Candidatus Azambacteria bacterium RIFCSPHIGHO2_01_46_10]OGD38144.1 MAG: Holliday junction DNA helicase RuvB [Candidatus Azambacteria bacterium RIFCSPLOWO2_01_FULL_46_26]OGD43128.1 MAG: Holliday junction DNA helicase RuvB [Candidatus Azambacteria bacterium RIFCSPLOWO2_02_FULL_46_11]
MAASISEPEDKILDIALRPKNWQEYIGQERIKNGLKILLEAAKLRQEPVDHLLFYGPAGLGKTTLAYIIAKEMSASLKITSGPAIEKIGDLASILTNLSPGDVLFIDEVHRLNKTIGEVLYPAMENRTLDIIIGKGPSARTIQLELPPFSLIAATTRIGLLSGPLRSRFGATFRLDFYENQDIEKIIARSAELLNVPIEKEAVKIIALSSRATPRTANRLLKRCRDYAQVKAGGILNKDVAEEALKMMEIDEKGLETTDRRLLEILIDKFEGGPVGLQTLAAAASEENDTIEDIYEPYLMQLGLINRTPKGRVATKRAYEHLGRPYPHEQTIKLL